MPSLQDRVYQYTYDTGSICGNWKLGFKRSNDWNIRRLQFMACMWWKGQKNNPNLTAKNSSFYRQIRIISVSWRKRFSTAVKKSVFTHVSALNTALIYHPTRLTQATHILPTPELPCESGPCVKYSAKWIPVECCSQLRNYTNECDNFSLTWCDLTHMPWTFLCNNVYCHHDNSNTCLNNVRVFRYKVKFIYDPFAP